MSKIRYKKAKEQDLPGFMDCLKSVYGDDSYYRRFYDPDYVRSRLGRIFVAEREGEIVGSLVLSDWGYKGEDDELSTFVVRKGLSDHNIGGDLLRYTLDAIRYLPSVKGANVTHHTASQILTERNGYLPTGLMFGVFLKKSPLILIIRNFNVKETGRIFVPDSLLPAAERLYQQMLGVSFERAVDKAEDAIPDTCDIWYEHDAHFQFLDVYIMSYGEDCLSRIAEAEAVCAQPDLTTNLYVDMRSPYAPRAYETLTKEGCVYTGFMPLSAGHEYIVLHRPGNGPIRYDEMKLTPGSEQALTRLGVALRDGPDVL
jgi:hypothetical protein